MKKSAIAFAAIVAASVAVSCQKEIALDSKSSEPMIINAVAEGIGATTKVEMAYRYDLLWQTGDQIYATDGKSNDKFTLSDGAGTTNGIFTQNGTASFSGEVEAFYPASIGGDRIWPAVQENNQTVPMYSKKTISGKTEKFNFSSLGAVLQIVFNSKSTDIILRSINIKDGSKTLSGAFTVDSNGQAVITATDKAGITLDLGKSGVMLGEGANYFNIAIPAGTYKDLTITFSAINGKECVMHSSTMPEVKSNTVGRLTLSGTFKKDVTALPGNFSVSATKKVQFSTGNLIYDVQTSKWGFYENQYDCASRLDHGLCSLFTWGYGYWSTIANTEKYTTGYPAGTNLSSSDDFGAALDSKGTWRTLTIDEWYYLFVTRTNASSLYRHSVTVCGKTNCLIIAPDDFTGTIDNSYDASSWPAAEAAGLVCLPAAGTRSEGSIFDMVGEVGYYWSSSAGEQNTAFYLFFSNRVRTDLRIGRQQGLSVRLITEL